MFKNFRNFKDEESDEFCSPFGIPYQQMKIVQKRNPLLPNIEPKGSSHPFKREKTKQFYKPRPKAKIKTLNFVQP